MQIPGIHCKKSFYFFSVIIFLSIVNNGNAQFQVRDNDMMARADSILSLMTLEEKVMYIAGMPGAKINAIPRLGLKSIRMSDGPLGVKAQAEGDQADKIMATAFPSGITMASTWNPELIYRVGEAIGVESKFNGIDILLGPSLNIIRLPQNGRNFEYYSEDPYLTSRMGVDYVKGLQSKKVLANIKHFAANNTEFNRYKSNSIVDSRTLHEIYLPAFEASVTEGGAATVMTAHNLLNGFHCAEDPFLLDTILRQQWQFNGFVISDWNSNYEVIPALKYGVDIEMPRPKVFAKDSVQWALKTGKASVKDIDEKVRRILYTCLYFGLYDKPETNRKRPDLDQHSKLALRVADEGTVLLKNENKVLPINRKAIKRIVVVGENADKTPLYGGGAAGMKTTRSISLLEGVRVAAGPDIEVDFLKYPESDAEKARIAEADWVVVGMGFNSVIEGEAHDRPFDLPSNQLGLINYLHSLDKKVIAVVYAGGSVNISPWLDKVKALFMGWYMGDATGRVVGRMIFGDVNPSGKLPITIEKRWEDSPVYPYYDTYASEAGMPPLFKRFYEKVNGPVAASEMIETKYGEGVFMGYRYFTTKGIEPLFPFGFGLSYSDFSIDDLKTNVGRNGISVSVLVTNIGKTDGAEVVQLYVGDNKASVPRPAKELKRFKKVFLSLGQSERVSFDLTEKDLSFWDVETGNWKAEPGTFTIYVGNSSGDNRLSAKVQWK